MKLVVSLTSPYARKIRIALAEKGLPFTLEVDIPWLPDTSVPSYNPLGKVPALVSDDGEVWYDSPVIALYLETLGGVPLMPAERVACLPVRQTEALADGISDAAVAVFLESRRPPEQQDAASIERQLTKIHRGLAALEDPRAFNQRVGIGPPDVRFEDSVVAQSHVARAGAHDQRHAARLHHSHTQHCSVGVDAALGHRDTRTQAQLNGGLRRQFTC